MLAAAFAVGVIVGFLITTYCIRNSLLRVAQGMHVIRWQRDALVGERLDKLRKKTLRRKATR